MLIVKFIIQLFIFNVNIKTKKNLTNNKQTYTSLSMGIIYYYVCLIQYYNKRKIQQYSILKKHLIIESYQANLFSMIILGYLITPIIKSDLVRKDKIFNRTLSVLLA